MFRDTYAVDIFFQTENVSRLHYLWPWVGLMAGIVCSRLFCDVITYDCLLLIPWPTISVPTQWSPFELSHKHCWHCCCPPRSGPLTDGILQMINFIYWVSNLSSTDAIPSSPVRNFLLISSICSCTEMKRVKTRHAPVLESLFNYIGKNKMNRKKWKIKIEIKSVCNSRDVLERWTNIYGLKNGICFFDTIEPEVRIGCSAFFPHRKMKKKNVSRLVILNRRYIFCHCTFLSPSRAYLLI